MIFYFIINMSMSILEKHIVNIISSTENEAYF